MNDVIYLQEIAEFAKILKKKGVSGRFWEDVRTSPFFFERVVKSPRMYQGLMFIRRMLGPR